MNKFVGYLLSNLKDLNLEEQLCQSLANWLVADLGEKKYQNLLKLLKQKQETEQTSNKNKEPCLLIAVFDDNNSLAVQGWLIEDIKS